MHCTRIDNFLQSIALEDTTAREATTINNFFELLQAYNTFIKHVYKLYFC